MSHAPLAPGCTCGHCTPECAHALLRPCCGACTTTDQSKE